MRKLTDIFPMHITVYDVLTVSNITWTNAMENIIPMSNIDDFFPVLRIESLIMGKIL